LASFAAPSAAPSSIPSVSGLDPILKGILNFRAIQDPNSLMGVLTKVCDPFQRSCATRSYCPHHDFRKRHNQPDMLLNHIWSRIILPIIFVKFIMPSRRAPFSLYAFALTLMMI
jgi:hypothetical protein